MRIRALAVVFAAIVLAWSLPALAHHSTAMFDRNTTITLSGTIAQFQWTNPHSWIQIRATGPDGTEQEWSIECDSPNSLSRRGWTLSMMKPGDVITLVVNPMKDGSNGALFVGMRLPDGREFGDLSAETGD